jgi:hypothetical protein
MTQKIEVPPVSGTSTHVVDWPAMISMWETGVAILEVASRRSRLAASAA